VALDLIIRDAFNTKTYNTTAVSGGMINQAAQVAVNGERYFIKWKPDAPPSFFEAETHGLNELRKAAAIRVPQVIKHAAAKGHHPAYLILEWIEPSTQVDSHIFAATFGQALAQLHRNTHDLFGLDTDNYIGELPQYNYRTGRWVEFYRDQRILPQVDLARENGYLRGGRETMLRRLMDQLDRLLRGVKSKPSLLHGDLWSGNFMVAANNQPVIYDPAVYYGEREVEIAFTELFGGFPSGFLQAYREVYPLDPGYESRRALYQLYPMLVHLNLFGESYGPRVDAICRHYLT
jgi:fructosamine-3-kinase